MDIARPGHSSQVDNCWVEMYYKHLRAVDRHFKDRILLYLIHSCTVLTKISRIQLEIAAEQGNICKSNLPKITVHHVDNRALVESIE